MRRKIIGTQSSFEEIERSDSCCDCMLLRFLENNLAVEIGNKIE